MDRRVTFSGKTRRPDCAVGVSLYTGKQNAVNQGPAEVTETVQSRPDAPFSGASSFSIEFGFLDEAPAKETATQDE
jgi:hypothetical protein